MRKKNNSISEVTAMFDTDSEVTEMFDTDEVKLGGVTVISTFSKLYQSFKDEVGVNVDVLMFIRMLNRLLSDIRITKPAEVFSNIYYCNKFRKYALPTYFRDPISLRDSGHNPPMSRVSPAIMSQYSYGESYALQNNNGVLYAEILHTRFNGVVSSVTTCESLTADGTWMAGAGVSSIALNTTIKKQGNSSVGFNISGSQAIITFTKTNVIDAGDFTEHQGFGGYFWLPTKPSNVILRWGSDSSNYYSQTLTKQSSGEEFDTSDYNELRTDRNSATETGSVDDDNIDWFQIEYNFSASITDTDFLIDDLIMFKPEIMKLEHYTACLAKDANGSLISEITEASDTTDVPLVYDEYLQTILDGLCWRFYLKKDKELANIYYSLYQSRTAPSGALTGGLRYILRKYPDKTQLVRNTIRLPQI
jgi:hypothetical protein